MTSTNMPPYVYACQDIFFPRDIRDRECILNTGRPSYHWVSRSHPQDRSARGFLRRLRLMRTAWLLFAGAALTLVFSGSAPAQDVPLHASQPAPHYVSNPS